MANPLVSDVDLAFVLHEVLDVASLCALPYFADHDRGTFDGYLEACRRIAREVLFPSYRDIDETPPHLDGGRVRVHPRMGACIAAMRELGVTSASRPFTVGGQQLPLTVSVAANLYLMAGNLSAYGYLGLTAGAAHLLETFGTEALKSEYLAPMYEGQSMGTMALTEPQAGSSLADVKTRATPTGDHYLLSGSKMFISGGDHDLAQNIVHMVLARIDGAPAGIKGVSLFLVPSKRGKLPNHIAVSGLIHKIGWRGLPSLALNFGENGDCHGWLLGEKHRGINHMFQMMNEARLMIGANGVATASVALHESLSYARERTQGRPATSRDPSQPQVALTQHTDVRRMLLRQKAIVEGGLSLLLTTAKYADLAEHAATEPERQHAQLCLDLLTPVAKSFPAERGYESNTLALQIHGGYGYSSEYLPEAWLRDQKLNSIHEGTTGIQAQDLLGRKVTAAQGAALQALLSDIARTCERASAAKVEPSWIEALNSACSSIAQLTMTLAQRGLKGDVEGMLLHATDYLELFSIFVVSWQWLLQAAVAREALSSNRPHTPFYEEKLLTAQYWLRTELPKIEPLMRLCSEAEDSYLRFTP